MSDRIEDSGDGWCKCGVPDCMYNKAALADAREEIQQVFLALHPECPATPGAPNTCHESLCDCGASDDLPGQIERLKAAHAAQLVALREAAAQRLCPHCRDGKKLIPPPPGWNFFYAHEDPAAGGCQQVGCAADGWWRHPLPDAEAALEKVREGAVREAVGKMTNDQLSSVWVAGSGYWHPSRPMPRPIQEGPASGAPVGCCFPAEMRSRLLGHALTALGAKP